jgi:beta-fructofuranosidase
MIPPVADPATLDGGARSPLLPETDPRRAAAPAGGGAGQRRPSSSTVLPAVVSAVLLLALAVVTILSSQHVDDGHGVVVMPPAGGVVEVAATRGVAEGVSEKSTAPLLGGGALRDYSWTNAMLAWQRTAFHFQPTKNWMNG